MTTTPRIVPCPQCKTAVPWGTQSPYRPFCSERCRLIDLGQWANEEYRVPVSGDDPMRELDSL
ncbi:MAG: DNA gyrase inhibitor YacG [Vogesella sp.]|uniref:DNA gyrase inhibitor YacG n=1 Tax=Vogesella sp. TaxID=1904252 RepID=UPI00391CD179